MSIVKRCKIHGDLTIEQVIKSKSLKEASLRCKECRRKSKVLNKRCISSIKYDELKRKQNELCAICYKKETRIGRSGELTPLCFDHCHITNKIRGLLCHSCNAGLGYAKDNIELLQNAINYLKLHEHVKDG